MPEGHALFGQPGGSLLLRVRSWAPTITPFQAMVTLQSRWRGRLGRIRLRRERAAAPAMMATHEQYAEATIGRLAELELKRSKSIARIREKVNAHYAEADAASPSASASPRGDASPSGQVDAHGRPHMPDFQTDDAWQEKLDVMVAQQRAQHHDGRPRPFWWVPGCSLAEVRSESLRAREQAGFDEGILSLCRPILFYMENPRV